MSAVIDILLILVFIITVISGVKNGFVRSILGIAAVIFSLVVSTTLAPHATDVVYEDIARIPIEHAIEEQLPQNEVIVISEKSVDEVIKALPDEFVQGAKSFGVDIDEIASSIGTTEISSKTAAKELAQNVARPVVTAVLRVIVFTALFLIINVILQIIITIVSGIVKLPVLKTLNSVLGGVFGAVKAVIVVSFMAVFLNAFSALIPESGFNLAIEGSKIVEFIMSVGIPFRLH